MAAAWVLNLDADLELAHGPGYVASPRMLSLMAPHVERAKSLLQPGDVLIDEGDERYVGRAWCPTPSALLRMQHVRMPEHPSFDVLRRVNARAFCAALGQPLGGVFATDLETALAAIKPNTRLKRNYGMAGRGHRVVDRVDQGVIDFLRAGMREGGVQIEPNVRITAEYARHGCLTRDGSLEVGHVVRQHCDAHGQWLSSERSSDVKLELAEVAYALHSAGYFGPFGVDAFAYEGGFQPLSEINARFSMGYAIGFSKS
jgi:hypothetical protein